MDGHRSDQRRAGLAWLIAASILVAACGGQSATPGPSATAEATGAQTSPVTGEATPTPSAPATPVPSPTPEVDLVAAAAKILASPTLTAKATVTGTVVQGDVTGALSGTMTFGPIGSATNLRIFVNGVQVLQDSLTLNGKAYARSNGGPWFEQPATSGGGAEMLKAVRGLEVRGTETVGTTTLHRLVNPTTLTPADLGITTPAGVTGEAGLVVLVTDDGTPKTMIVDASWPVTGADGSVATSATHMELAFDCIGCTVAIAEPEEVFGLVTSKKLGYTIAVPHDWDAKLATKAADADWFYSPDDRALGVWRYSTGLTLNQYAKEYVEFIKSGEGGFKKVKNVTSNATTVGNLKAMRLTFHCTLQGTAQYVITYFVKVKGQMLEIDLLASPGYEAEDDAFMELVRMATTVK